MSQTSQDSAIPMDSTLANAPSRIVIGANDEVSIEKLLQDLNLPTELRERIQVQSMTEGGNRRRFVIPCPDYWAWDQVLQSACLLSNEYYVNPGLRSSSSSPGEVEHESPVGLATPTSGLTPGPSTFGTVLNTPAFASPWATQATNSLQSPLWEVPRSPYLLQALNNIPGTIPVFSAEATPSLPTPSSVFQSSAGAFKQEETSDDDRDFFAVAEGEEEYVQEWDGRNAGEEEEEDGESSPSGGKSLCSNVKAEESLLTTIAELYHYPDPEADGPTPSITDTNEEEEESMTSDNTGGPDSDQEMTEEDEAEAIVEEPITSGHEADHSESDAARSPQQRRQGTPHPRAALPPSDLRAISETPPTTGNAGIAEIDDPPANQSTTQGTNNVLGPLLNSTEDEPMEDAAEPAMDGLVNGLLGLALPPPNEVQTGPSLQPGQIITLGEPPQDSPNTSAESDVLRDLVEQSLNGTLDVDYFKATVPVGHEGNGFVEFRQE